MSSLPLKNLSKRPKVNILSLTTFYPLNIRACAPKTMTDKYFHSEQSLWICLARLTIVCKYTIVRLFGCEVGINTISRSKHVLCCNGSNSIASKWSLDDSVNPFYTIFHTYSQGEDLSNSIKVFHRELSVLERKNYQKTGVVNLYRFSINFFVDLF